MLQTPDEVADFALMHVTSSQGAIVKALANGIVETMIDAKGRTSVVLTGDDGTRYWYADVGRATVTDGARVQAGQDIARTKPGAKSIPEITPVVRRSELTVGDGTPTESKKPKPAQVVFVEPPPEPPGIEQPKSKRWVRLVPIDPPSPPASNAPRKPVRKPVSIVRTIVTAGLFAAFVYAIASIGPRPPRPRTPKPRARKRKRRRR